MNAQQTIEHLRKALAMIAEDASRPLEETRRQMIRRIAEKALADTQPTNQSQD